MMSYQMAIWREYHRAAKYAKYVMNRDDVDRKSSFFRKLAKEWKSNLLGMCVCVCVCVCREKGGGSTYFNIHCSANSHTSPRYSDLLKYMF